MLRFGIAALAVAALAGSAFAEGFTFLIVKSI